MSYLVLSDLQFEIEEELGIEVESVRTASSADEYFYELGDGTSIVVNSSEERYGFRFEPETEQDAQDVAEYLKEEYRYRPL